MALKTVRVEDKKISRNEQPAAAQDFNVQLIYGQSSRSLLPACSDVLRDLSN